MFRAIVFDFDGTIADTIPAIREGLNLTMEKYGYPTHDDAAVRRFINNGARELVRAAMPEALRGDEALVGQVLADYDAFYGTTYHHTERAYRGMAELIAAWHDAGVKIGVLSNKQDCFVSLLSHQVLQKGSFDAAQGMLPGKPSKPHPFLSERLAASLGVSPSECILVGDSDVDIRTAQNAGMCHIGVTWGYRNEAFLREGGATRLAHTPNELNEILKDLLKKGNRYHAES